MTQRIMSPGQHLMTLRIQRELIAGGSKLWWDDDNTIGNKHTECSWGLCSCNKMIYPLAEMHIWPDQFEKDDRVAPIDRGPDQKCPFDNGETPKQFISCGCFYRCMIFQSKKKGLNRMPREKALELYDEEIKKIEVILTGEKDGVKEVDIYYIGPLSCSVCSSLSPEETIKRVNELHPSGTTNGWVISDQEKFASGEPHPCPCQDHPDTHKHYYLEF
jgi:hypothetical protein